MKSKVHLYLALDLSNEFMTTVPTFISDIFLTTLSNEYSFRPNANVIYLMRQYYHEVRCTSACTAWQQWNTTDSIRGAPERVGGSDPVRRFCSAAVSVGFQYRSRNDHFAPDCKRLGTCVLLRRVAARDKLSAC